MAKFVFGEEKLELVLAGVVEEIMSDASLADDIKNRIQYKIINDDEFRGLVMKIAKAVLVYCTIAAEDKTGVGLMTLAEAQLPRITDHDAMVLAHRLLVVNAGRDSEMMRFADTSMGVGSEIFNERIKVLIDQLG